MACNFRLWKIIVENGCDLLLSAWEMNQKAKIVDFSQKLVILLSFISMIKPLDRALKWCQIQASYH